MFNNFEFFNPNPCNQEVGDCVVRALCKATNRDWVSIYDELCNFGRDLGDMPNGDITLEEFFDYNGFARRKIARPKKGTKSMTVVKFCKEFQKGTYILHAAHHLVTVVDGKYYDLYPSSGNCKVYTYWEKV